MYLDKKLNRILLVDDDYINNFLNEEIIREMAVVEDVITFTGAQEALNWLGENDTPVDLIFLDINMPGLDGFEFLDELSRLNLSNKIPIVLLTTSDNIRDKDKAKTRNISGYINKPLSKEKLLLCFQELKNNHKDLVD